MNCKLKCTNPEDIEYSITITATAKQFESLRDDLNNRNWPLGKSISDLLVQANQTFTMEES